LLLRQVERRVGLLNAVAKVSPDPRVPALVHHTTEQRLRQRVFGLCQGYEDLNDHDRLRGDPVLQTAVGMDCAAASNPSLCRFENRADRQAAVAITRQLVEQFIGSFPKAPEELVLDFDATDDLAHGQQEGRSFNDTTTPTASCRCTSSAGSNCWSPTCCGRRSATRRHTRQRS
jgi:hypothetical protein